VTIESQDGGSQYPRSCFAYKKDSWDGCALLSDRLCAREKKRCAFYKTPEEVAELKSKYSYLPMSKRGGDGRAAPV
jgi:hypothetical protein